MWAHAASMAGVNAELGPWIRMSVPRAGELEPQRIEPPGVFVFHSWLLLGGVLPFDRHALHLLAMDPEQMSFHERSSSWTFRVWEHQRRIEALASRRCRLTDRLNIEPRIAAIDGLALRIVQRVFDHRHQVLRARFGSG